jgi:hypothetical protein
MTVRRVVFVAVAVMASAWLRPAGAASPEAEAKAFVQKFYDAYMPVVQAEKEAPASNYVVEKMSGVLDPVLLAGLKEDMAAAAAAPEGELVGLDFDPFLDAQDPADRYEVTSVSKKGTTYLADVYCVTEGKRSDKPCVVPELVQDNGTWRFVNFDYPEGGDLLTVLKDLKAEREKPSSN